MTTTGITITCAALALLGGCNAEPDRTIVPAAAPGASQPTRYQSAVDRSDRSAADRSRDANRKPAEVLAFYGIEPGMSVLDMFSGGGYYSELLSRIVGPQGRVVAHSNRAYADSVGDEIALRYGNNRLSNVEMLMAENNELDLPAAGFDAIMMILAYHDIYYVAPENGWPKINGPKLLAELYEGLKPGGILAVVDHAANPGSPRETGNTLHRIDPQIVIAELQAAGFVLEGESDVLHNPSDDRNLPMADPRVRGTTDRFVLRFRKPR